MSFPRYPKYKDSGVEWLGEVPEHWDVSPLKSVATHNDDVLDESTPPETEIVYVDISGVDAQDGITVKEPMLFDAAPSRARRRVKHGDTIVSTVRTYLRAIARVRHPEQNLIVSTGFAVIRPRADLVPDYVGFVLSASYFIEQVIARSTGVSYPAINASELVGIPVVIPPPNEQTAIAAFLDRETAKIDGLVAEQRRLIELQKEKRQAVISHAVTKGLNPNAPMKPSGIEWLGDVPEHWQLVPFARVIDFQEGPGIMASDFHDDGVPLLRLAGAQGQWATLDGCNYLDPEKVAKRWEHFRLSVGDLLISGSASMGTVCEVGSEAAGAIPYTGLIRLSGRSGMMEKRYIKPLVTSSLFSVQIDHLKSGATIQHFGPTHLAQVKVLKLPIDEQLQIAAFVESEQAKFDTLTAEAERAISLLQERRTALISSAVTGKIDVRGLAEGVAA